MRHFFRLTFAIAIVGTCFVPRASASIQKVACEDLPSVNSLTVMQLASLLIVPTINASNIAGATAIAAQGYGGLMVTGSRAPAKFAQSVALVQQASQSQMPLYVMTDAEGGGVLRLANALPLVPWAHVMGQWSSSRITAQGSQLGASLSSLGVNMDLAPVADVDSRNVIPGATNPDGLRSFSGKPNIAGADAAAFMAGLQAQNVVAVAKHFPGIGYSTGNSDFGPAASLSWRALQTSGLVPFRTLISSNVPVIMMSNDWTPGFSTLPASLDPAMYTYLRSTLHFGGLVITDSLSAGAVSSLHLGLSMSAVRAIGAGADLVLLGGSSTVAQALSNANSARASIAISVRSGILPLQTLQNAASSVWAAKTSQFCTN
jgi:beta-N-acetylhexosaminidase